MGTLAPGPRIHGREAEARVLSEVLDRVAAGRLAVALIEGEAGIGKTRLLEDVLENARARGMLVASGRAEELERNRPARRRPQKRLPAARRQEAARNDHRSRAGGRI